MKQHWMLCVISWSVLFLTATAPGAERTTYFVPDASGSPVAAMDEQGNLLWRKTYAPYGEEQNPPQGNPNPSYTGKPKDADTGLVYMGSRMYDPETGRFTGEDPRGFSESSIQSFNRYTYANNSPYVYVDPNGEWASKWGAYVHQRATYQVIGKNLPRGENAILAKAQVYADGNEFQTGAMSFRHTMSGPDETPEQAREKANEFVRGQFEKAWSAKTREDALFQFGVALHTLQDATSPSHEGFQQWTGHESKWEKTAHAAKEVINPGPGSELHQVTEQAWQWFNNKKLPAGDLFKK